MFENKKKHTHTHTRTPETNNEHVEQKTIKVFKLGLPGGQRIGISLGLVFYTPIFIQEGFAQTAALRVLVRSEGGLEAKVNICNDCAADSKRH